MPSVLEILSSQTPAVVLLLAMRAGKGNRLQVTAAPVGHTSKSSASFGFVVDWCCFNFASSPVGFVLLLGIGGMDQI